MLLLLLPPCAWSNCACSTSIHSEMDLRKATRIFRVAFGGRLSAMGNQAVDRTTAIDATRNTPLARCHQGRCRQARTVAPSEQPRGATLCLWSATARTTTASALMAGRATIWLARPPDQGAVYVQPFALDLLQLVVKHRVVETIRPDVAHFISNNSTGISRCPSPFLP
eukprot:COSAG06_NODE_2834_length_6204_cov_12.577396_4_plen_168_part_00